MTRDVRRAARAFAARHGTAEFRIHDVTVECSLYPGICSLRVAVAWIADKQIELIEPVAGAVDLYLRVLPEDRDAVAFHHVGVHVPGSLQDWDKKAHRDSVGR